MGFKRTLEVVFSEVKAYHITSNLGSLSLFVQWAPPSLSGNNSNSSVFDNLSRVDQPTIVTITTTAKDLTPNVKGSVRSEDHNGKSIPYPARFVCREVLDNFVLRFRHKF